MKTFRKRIDRPYSKMIGKAEKNAGICGGR